LHVVDESPRTGDEPIAAEAWMSLTDHRDILALCPARLYQAGTAGRVDVSVRR
jgi:ferredoxin-like protein FixX